MRNKYNKWRLNSILLSMLLCAVSTAAQTNVFTYQGKLTDTAGPSTATFQMEFRLYDAAAGGTQIGQEPGPA